MYQTSRQFLYILTIVAVVLMSAMGPTVAYAEGGTEPEPASAEPQNPTPVPTSVEQPPADTTQESQPPAEEPPADGGETSPGEESPTTETGESPLPPAEEPPADGGETSPGEESPTTEIGESPLPPAEESPTEETSTVPEIMEQTPEGTELVVLNEEGTAEPLTTQAAAEILEKGDPVWCPEGQAPTPDNNGCTPSYSSFAKLIEELEDENFDTYAGNGVIWVEANYDRTKDNNPILFDGDPLGDLSDLDNLTIMGGWNGTDGSTGTDPSTPSLLDDPLSIFDWIGDITIKNLDFENVVSSSAALNIETIGDITLNNVSVTDTADTAAPDSGIGASLDNCLESVGICTGSGNVTVLNSSFSNNDHDGLQIFSDDSVTVKNVTTTNNGDDGIWIDLEGSTDSSVNISNVISNNNPDDGIDINLVDGTVTMEDITVTGNDDEGVEISEINGDIILTKITATGNDDDGIDIYDSSGNVTINNSTTSNNNSSGVEIGEHDGDLTMICHSANNNSDDGVEIEDNLNGKVILKCSEFKSNTNHGVNFEDDSPTSVQLLSVTATGNGGENIIIDPGIADVTIKTVPCCCGETTSKPKPKPAPLALVVFYIYTELNCTPPDISAFLRSEAGNEVFFTNLCDYKAAVLDKSSPYLPKSIPGGDEYSKTLHKVIKDKYQGQVTTGQDQQKEYKIYHLYKDVLYGLPTVMPEGDTYLSGLLTVVLDENGQYLDPLPEGAKITVKFLLPKGLDDDAELAIMRWDGQAWSDLGGLESEDGLYFQVDATEIGFFVLVVR